MKEKVKKFYLHLEISDQMRFDNKTWNDIKEEVLMNEEYKSQKWYIDLTSYEKDLLEDLRQI